MTKKRKIAAYIFGALIAATLAFIWINSCLNKTASSETSEYTSGFIQSVLDFIFGKDAITVSEGVIRKLAHFSEFFLLGAEIYCFYIAVKYKGVNLTGQLGLLQFGLYTAVIDEGIQILSDRGPLVQDIFIDFCGYLTAVLISVAIYYIVKKIKKRKKDIK